jgi:hypothetical protein
MKTNVKNSVLALSILVFAVSCKKEEPTPTETPITITEDDAADLVASSIGTGTYGVSSSTNEAAQRTTYAYNQPVPCLYSLDTTIVKQSPNGGAISYNYNLNYGYQMYCTNAVPTSLVCTMSSTGQLDQIRMSASSTASGSLTFTGLAPSASQYTLSGTYQREGSASSKVRAKNSFTYNLTINISDFLVNKTSYQIEGGSSTVSLVATTSTGKTFSFSGSLSYIDENTASLVIGSRTFTINIPNSTVN